MRELAGRGAFVTGAASGLGFAMARRLGLAGMRVALADVEAVPLAAAVARLEAEGLDVLGVPVDVTSRPAMAQAAAVTLERFGKVHVLCNNAGVSVAGPVDRMQWADWDWVLGVNLGGVVNGVQTFVPHLEAHGEGGHIVNTASISGQVADAAMAPYVASKFAVVGLSESIRQDLAPLGIGVTVVCPHAVATNIVRATRNRPAHLQRERTGAPPSAEALARRAMVEAAIEATFAQAMDPDRVAAMVVDAIRADDPYVFSHPGTRAGVAARFDAIAASYDRWARWSDEWEA